MASSEAALGDDVEADLCIVGSGPAGLTLAQAFAGTPVRVVVIESGREVRDPQADELNEIESIGAPRVMDQERLRTRIYGGTSQVWTGRCGPLDDIDCDARDWVPFSGWPVGMRELEPYFDRAATLMKLGPAFFDERAWRVLNHWGIERNPLAPDMRNVFWQFSRPLSRGRYFQFGLDLVNVADNIRTLLGWTVTSLDVAPGKHPIVQLAARDNTSRSLRARIVVLAAGGIENPRLMLASRDAHGRSLGNEYDTVGRYLMDHPRTTLLSLDPKSSGRIQKEFGHFWVKSGSRLYDYQRGLGISPEVQRRDRLLNCAAWLVVTPIEGSPKEAVKRIASHRSPSLPDDVATIAKGLPEITSQGFQRFAFRQSAGIRASAAEFSAMVEQTPSPDSRLTLGERRDRFGTPLPRIDWRIAAEERATMRRLSTTLAAEMTARGQHDFQLPEWVARGRDEDATFLDVAHPTGATRMSDDPRHGVVDRNARVHGQSSIYVAGSSVFPTGGHVNPTMTIVALSLRLADHLKATVFV